MAWNPSPKVAAARDAAKKFNYPKVIICFIDEENGKLEMASYGRNRKECDECKEIADKLLDDLETYVKDLIWRKGL